MQPVSSTPNPPTAREPSGGLPEARRSPGGPPSPPDADPVPQGHLDAPAASAAPCPAPSSRGPRPGGRAARTARGPEGRSGNDLSDNINEPAKTEPPQRLDDVLRAIIHHQTLALISEHLVEYVADTFRGNEARGPKKLLALPNGTRCRAELEDVAAVERVLRRLAADARKKVVELHRAEVVVEPAAVALTEVSNTPISPPPEGECVVDARPAASSAAETKGS